MALHKGKVHKIYLAVAVYIPSNNRPAGGRTYTCVGSEKAAVGQSA